ncbi:hypothetical protein [Polyangium sp. 6x1]|uniref:hypothetical protein n=1 Tax=Polyangium sp. 6x1 TaxID=3042689 RepID=UPI0024824F49|nr:hypothetical protein [Polyangium sp. 6x1]MDI1451398.1 hypothetical protein [Polyangium sp. 6x1]
MSIGPKAAYNGTLTIDVSALKNDLVDLPPGGTQNLKHEKPGFDDVLVELQKAKTGALSNAGIALDIVTRIEDRTAKLAEIRQKKAEAEKLAEVLRETEAELEHAREGDVALVAKGVQTAVQHVDAGVAAHFEKTSKYYSQIADKAVATRRKNAEAKEVAETTTP